MYRKILSIFLKVWLKIIGFVYYKDVIAYRDVLLGMFGTIIRRKSRGVSLRTINKTLPTMKHNYYVAKKSHYCMRFINSKHVDPKTGQVVDFKRDFSQKIEKGINNNVVSIEKTKVNALEFESMNYVLNSLKKTLEHPCVYHSETGVIYNITSSDTTEVKLGNNKIEVVNNIPIKTLSPIQQYMHPVLVDMESIEGVGVELNFPDVKAQLKANSVDTMAKFGMNNDTIKDSSHLLHNEGVRCISYVKNEDGSMGVATGRLTGNEINEFINDLPLNNNNNNNNNN